MSTPTPRLTRPRFHAWVAPAGVDPDTAADADLEYVHLTINSADQLRAELEASRHGIDQRKHMMHLTTLWLWAAAVRAYGYEGDYRTWKRALVSYSPDKETADDAEQVDPTEASTS
jgi:hypothetical protein